MSVTAPLSDALLQRLSGLADLEASDLDLVRGWCSSSYRTKKRADIIIADGCRVLMSGVAARYQTSTDGRERLLSLYFPGDFIDPPQPANCRAATKVQAVNDLTYAIVPMRTIRDIAACRPALNQALIASILIEAAIAREWLLQLGHRHARGRLAHLLCEIGVRMKVANMGEVDNYPFPFKQDQLGSVLGLTAVHVNRTLRSLQDTGVLRYDIGHLAIGDIDRLRRIGEFDPTYLQVPTR